MLDRALAEAGIDRAKCYVTNAVKQFIYTERGKRRLHKRPTTSQVVHYRWWLEQEISLVDPGIVVALGATALYALSGKRTSVTAARGPMRLLDHAGYVTVHPSSLLRMPFEADRRAARAAFVADLRAVSSMVQNGMPFHDK
ncbi:MAG: uracil-DNA glycosylase family protein [Hyphomicrobiales bacterium]